MKAIIAAGLMAGMALLGGAGVAQADDASCPVTQLCGPVSREYAGDRDGDRYRELLNSYGMSGSTASAVKICDARRRGRSSDQIISDLTSNGVPYTAAVNAIGMGMYHFCPNYWDMG